MKSPIPLTSALARRYADEHGDARLLVLRELDFDPINHYGYRGEQPLEPDLADALDAIFAADHITVATPTWWASTPALLKGFFDRVLLPKVTYRYRSNGEARGPIDGTDRACDHHERLPVVASAAHGRHCGEAGRRQHDALLRDPPHQSDAAHGHTSRQARRSAPGGWIASRERPSRDRGSVPAADPVAVG